ncbi:MAG: neutral zinc metallopeptidase [Verrucomicrobiota bacterium]
MRWEGRRKSRNVEDRRGRRGRRGGGMAMSGGTLILIIILALVFKQNPLSLLEQVGGGPGMGAPVESGAPLTAEQKRMGDFVATVLADTEDIWTEEFRQMGRSYEAPRMVLFSTATQSGCGFANAQVGPFYCPADRTIYIDLSFFEELKRRFGAPGDFAQAYVIAHEVGHHVQNQLGISGQVHRKQQQLRKAEANELSVRLELQADFLAGLWARKGQDKFNFLEAGDIEEALRAANAIGDDTLQKQAQGRVVPDSFTHGTSEQRMRWFMKGFKGEAFDPNNTFSARDL